MPKHSKKVKAEKAKVKLKGAVLQKGLNVTKTDFKVRKIIIREQLKDTQNADGTFVRKYNAKELLSHLNHHNLSFRTDSLKSMKEMIATDAEETLRHLSSIIQGLSKLCLDIERNIRRESFKVLGLLFSSCTADTVEPFFDVLSSFLRCAMTHIQTNIQEDSLLMLDVLLTHTPRLVAVNSDKIFVSFLDMISKLKTDNKSERTLSVNLGSKMTSVKWRTRVLDRLLGMLSTMVTHRRQKARLNVVGLRNAGESLVADAFTLTAPDDVIKGQKSELNRFTDDNPMHFPVIRSYLNVNCELSSLFKKDVDHMSSGVLDKLDESKRIKQHVMLLLPLIMDTWMEVRPAIRDEYKTEIVISNEAAFTLKIYFEIIDQLWLLMLMWDNEVNSNDLISWFQGVFSCHSFVEEFPYVQEEAGNRKSKTNEKDVYTAGGPKCVIQNLAICRLYMQLEKDSPRGFSNKKLLDMVLNYIKKTSHNIAKLNTIEIRKLVSVYRIIFLKNRRVWKMASESLKEILDILLATGDGSKTSRREFRNNFMSLLCDVCLDDEMHRFNASDSFNLWLQKLPLMLTEATISAHTLETLAHLGKRQNNLFLESMSANRHLIIDNLSDIEITGIDDQFEGKKLIVNLLYWLKDWDVNRIEECVSRLPETIEVGVLRYLKQTLLFRLEYQ